mmetsp:Transcript_9419/g.19289  ORF Transcript_9419/g.19289 Transcript_9419/m.19289 type:complete len:96 (-) Transcript_9419:428-715(-)
MLSVKSDEFIGHSKVLNETELLVGGSSATFDEPPFPAQTVPIPPLFDEGKNKVIIMRGLPVCKYRPQPFEEVIFFLLQKNVWRAIAETREWNKER